MKRISLFFTILLVLGFLGENQLFAAKPIDLSKNKTFLSAFQEKGASSKRTNFSNLEQASRKTLSSVFGFNKNESLQLIQTQTDLSKASYSTYRQVYLGIPVWGRQISLKQNAQGQIKGLRGILLKEIEKDLPSIPKSLGYSLQDALR